MMSLGSTVKTPSSLLKWQPLTAFMMGVILTSACAPKRETPDATEAEIPAIEEEVAAEPETPAPAPNPLADLVKGLMSGAIAFGGGEASGGEDDTIATGETEPETSGTTTGGDTTPPETPMTLVEYDAAVLDGYSQLAAAAPTAYADDASKLEVLTFNVWDLPSSIAPSHRVGELCLKLKSLASTDVVALQEVWIQGHRDFLIANCGFEHSAQIKDEVYMSITDAQADAANIRSKLETMMSTEGEKGLKGSGLLILSHLEVSAQAEKVFDRTELNKITSPIFMDMVSKLSALEADTQLEASAKIAQEMAELKTAFSKGVAERVVRKGALVVTVNAGSVGEISILNTHLSSDYSLDVEGGQKLDTVRASQIGEIASLVASVKESSTDQDTHPVVLVGDLNQDASSLGNLVEVAKLPEGAVTYNPRAYDDMDSQFQQHSEKDQASSLDFIALGGVPGILTLSEATIVFGDKVETQVGEPKSTLMLSDHVGVAASVSVKSDEVVTPPAEGEITEEVAPAVEIANGIKVAEALLKVGKSSAIDSCTANTNEDIKSADSSARCCPVDLVDALANDGGLTLADFKTKQSGAYCAEEGKHVELTAQECNYGSVQIGEPLAQAKGLVLKCVDGAAASVEPQSAPATESGDASVVGQVTRAEAALILAEGINRIFLADAPTKLDTSSAKAAADSLSQRVFTAGTNPWDTVILDFSNRDMLTVAEFRTIVENIALWAAKEYNSNNSGGLKYIASTEIDSALGFGDSMITVTKTQVESVVQYLENWFNNTL